MTDTGLPELVGDGLYWQVSKTGGEYPEPKYFEYEFFSTNLPSIALRKRGVKKVSKWFGLIQRDEPFDIVIKIITIRGQDESTGNEYTVYGAKDVTAENIRYSANFIVSELEADSRKAAQEKAKIEASEKLFGDYPPKRLD